MCVYDIQNEGKMLNIYTYTLRYDREVPNL